MRNRPPFKQRSVYRYVSKIHGGRVVDAFKAVQLKYGIPRTGLDSHGIPRCDISLQELKSRHTDRLICGGTHPNRTFTLFEPGIHSRAVHGFSLRLTVLETSLHEIVHCIDGDQSFPATFTDTLSTETGERKVGGFREAFYVDNEQNVVRNEIFNEGVTQLFALEVMREYLAQGAFINVTKRECDQHFRHIRAHKPGTFYPLATSFVQAFALRIGEVLGSERAAFDKLYQDLFTGVSLQNDNTWVALMRAAGIERIMRSVRTVNYKDIPIYEALLRRTRGAWEEVEALPLANRVK